MARVGQPEKILLETYTEMEVAFTWKKVSRMNKFDNPCVEEESYSLTECLIKFVEKETQCSISVAFDKLQSVECPLKNKKNITAFFEKLIWIKDTSLSELSNATGCYQKCTIREYSYEITKKEDVTWLAKWGSSFYLQPKFSFHLQLEEHLSYDLGDLFAAVGGYLGLFLGWSLLSLWEVGYAWIKQKTTICHNNRRL